MTDLPSTIAIIGGGRRGVEFAIFLQYHWSQGDPHRKGESDTPQNGPGDLHPV